MEILLILIQVLILIFISPFISGIIRKLKNSLRMRVGPPILQPYYNLIKLFSKNEVVSENSSIIFKAAPYVVLASAITAAFLTPLFGFNFSANMMGDLFALIFILALGRFFISLAGLDAASTFSGMGSSREMFISSLVEPVALLSLFVVSLNSNSTGLFWVATSFDIKLSTIIAGIALFIVALAETSRIPIDNQETHLELTMVHEAMALEYSGRPLAAIELASHIKQMVFFSLIALFFFPLTAISSSGAYQMVFSVFFFLLKILGIAFVISVIEVSIAKMRLFRIVDFLGFAFILCIAALIIQTMGM